MSGGWRLGEGGDGDEAAQTGSSKTARGPEGRHREQGQGHGSNRGCRWLQAPRGTTPGTCDRRAARRPLRNVTRQLQLEKSKTK